MDTLTDILLHNMFEKKNTKNKNTNFKYLNGEKYVQ